MRALRSLPAGGITECHAVTRDIREVIEAARQHGVTVERRVQRLRRADGAVETSVVWECRLRRLTGTPWALAAALLARWDEVIARLEATEQSEDGDDVWRS